MASIALAFALLQSLAQSASANDARSELHVSVVVLGKCEFDTAPRIQVSGVRAAVMPNVTVTPRCSADRIAAGISTEPFVPSAGASAPSFAATSTETSTVVTIDF